MRVALFHRGALPLFISVLFLCIRYSDTCNADAELGMIPCKLLAVIEDDDNDSENEIMTYKCEVDEENVYEIENSNLELHELLESPNHNPHGLSLVFNYGAYYSLDGKSIVVPSDAEFGILTNMGERDFDTNRGGRGLGLGRRLGGRDPVGDQTVMVVYFRDSTGKTPSRPAMGEANSIESDIFGTYGDPVSLASVYENCSNGHVDFVPYVGTTSTGATVTTGVYEVDLGMAVTGADRSDVESAARSAAASALGPLSSQFDYVIFCVPSGSLRSGGGWVGYAYIDSWLGVYNDSACSSPSVLAHEIGHNINLGHSGTPSGGQYGDTTGYMGYGSGADDSPIKCFNGPKMHQLKWYEDYHVDLTSADFSYLGNLYGFVDEDNIAASATDKMFVKLDGTTNPSNTDYTDYYVAFNRASGANSGTTNAHKNKVLIHKSQNQSRWAPKSTLVAVMSEGDTEIIVVQGIEVTVVVSEINLSASPPYAKVNIFAEPSPMPSISISPSRTPSPSSVPSLSLQPTATSAPSVSSYVLTTEFLFGDFYVDSKGGVMFDITTTEDIAINKLDIKLFYPGPPAVDTDTVIEMWVKDDTYADDDRNLSNAWTKHLGPITVQGFTAETGLLVPLEFPYIFVGAGKTKSIFLTNLDSKNFIEISSVNSAIPHTDGVVTANPGKFSKYNWFQGTGGYDLCSRVPFQFSGSIHYKLSANFASEAPSTSPSAQPSLSMVPSSTPSSSPSKMPSSVPSKMPSSAPSLSQVPTSEPSSIPSASPSVSIMPSSEPSSTPSASPSVSIMPSSEPSSTPSASPSVSIMPSSEPSALPSDAPSNLPSISPSDVPSTIPSSMPSLEPTRFPTKRPTKNPTNSPTNLYFPSASPTVSIAPTTPPTANPTASPTVPQRFQVITPRCYCRSPLRGISSSELSLRFSLMVAIWEAAVTAELGPDRSGWGTKVISMGNRDVRKKNRRLLEITSYSDDGAQLTTRFLQEDGDIFVEYEVSTNIVCENETGCTAEESSAALKSGLDTVAALETSVESGSFTKALVEETETAYATAGIDEVPNLVVDEIATEAPDVVTRLPDMRFISVFKLDDSKRNFCLQVMNFRVNAVFKMRPCEYEWGNLRQKQLWALDAVTGQIYNKVRKEWCMTWAGGKKKELRLGMCESSERKTAVFEFDEAEKAIIVTNANNDKKFFIGFDTTTKYEALRLYGMKTKNESVHAFEQLFT